MGKLKSCVMLVGVMLGLLVVAGCTANTPESVAENFINALLEGEMEEAKGYCSEDLKEQKNMNVFLTSVNIGLKMVMQAGDTDNFYEIVDSEIKDSTAQIKIKYTSGDTIIVDFVQDNEEWYITSWPLFYLQ